MPELWTPLIEGPHEAFVERLHRTIARFGEETGLTTPLVELALADTSRFALDRIEPEPGFGMVTIYVHARDTDSPDALVIPIGSIRRIELRRAPEEHAARLGFSVPPPRRPAA
jgi:hypothetical protein